MSDQCDICGIVALEGQNFSIEHFPLRRAKRYCPACRAQLLQRVYALVALFVLLLVLLGLIQAYRAHGGSFEYNASWYGFLVVCQWLMILPHELGHALAAKAVRCTQIRVIIGCGRPLFDFSLGGISFLVNLVPFGGLTPYRPSGMPNRWQSLMVIGAGPLVNLICVVIAWHFIGPARLFDNTAMWPKLFFWANVTVLVQNLFPYVFQTPVGPLANDGLQLWTILFRWNKPVTSKTIKVPLWEFVICQILKWGIFLLTLAATVSFGVLAVVPFVPASGVVTWEAKLLLTPIMLTLTLVAGWITVRIARNPVARVRKSVLVPQAVFLEAGNRQILQRAIELKARHDLIAAEAALDELLASLPQDRTMARLQVLLLKLDCIVSQGALERAEKACVAAAEQAANQEQKIRILDGFACQLLYAPVPVGLETAERVARHALAIAPGTLTLKGTLGSLLAEQAKIAEAEPLLQECLDRSPAIHDQAISSFYLGIVKLRKGELQEAKRLINRGRLLFPEPWLLVKAKLLLNNGRGP